MQELLDKLSSYNIFNHLLPGVLFVILADKYTSYTIIQSNLLLGIFLYYFIGLLISRIGSLCVEPVFLRLGCIKFSSYEDFVSAEKKDSKIGLLLETGNMYRTLISLFLCLSFLKAFDCLASKCPFIQNWQMEILLIVMLALFLWSYIKQMKYLTKRIYRANKE